MCEGLVPSSLQDVPVWVGGEEHVDRGSKHPVLKHRGSTNN